MDDAKAAEDALFRATEEDLAALHARLVVRFQLDEMGAAFHPMNSVAEAVDKLRWKTHEARLKARRS